MAWIRRKWTAEDADEWTKEDIIASVLSAISYITLTVGVMLSIFNLWYGWVTLAIGIIATILMFYIIDPKLKTISTSYEKKQKKYLDDLERINRWEEI